MNFSVQITVYANKIQNFLSEENIKVLQPNFGFSVIINWEL